MARLEGQKQKIFKYIKLNKQVTFAMLGNCLEFYDVTLYSFFAALLAPLFFPSASHSLSLLASFSAFALGIAMRPLGGIVFGHLGDQYGRKYALRISLVLIATPTLIIGLLPTYESLGPAAPLVLVLCLLLQGLCVGGEYSGASVFVVEHTKKKWPGFWSASLIASGFLGGLIGTLIGALFTQVCMPSWGWRVPFLIGGVVSLIGFYRFYRLQETPDFQLVMDTKATIRKPLLSALKNQTVNFLCVVCVGSASFIPLYTATTYLGSILLNDLRMPHSHIMLVYSLVMTVYLIFLPIMGSLADRLGAKKVMATAALSMIIFSYPLFGLLLSKTVSGIIINQVFLAIVNTAFSGPSLLFKAGLFPTNTRHSALGFGYNLGGAIFGGTSPLICASLVNWTGNYRSAAFYIIFGAMLGLIGVSFSRKIDTSFEEDHEKAYSLKQLVA